MRFLLDTHVLLRWHGNDHNFSPAHRRIVRRAQPEEPLWLSDISRWEVALLHERGRIRLSLPLRDWLEQATAHPLVRSLGITSAVAAEAVSLPATTGWDPADRIIVASARVLGSTLLTQDRQIIDSGLVRTIE